MASFVSTLSFTLAHRPGLGSPGMGKCASEKARRADTKPEGNASRQRNFKTRKRGTGRDTSLTGLLIQSKAKGDKKSTDVLMATSSPPLLAGQDIRHQRLPLVPLNLLQWPRVRFAANSALAGVDEGVWI
ncbi:hypothetical protein FF011L_37130 [Roseimaritima multifibrata]|uniref:Uncharacterized protein n=1 Tax=Roseimaritima multifibrata TaxID=1930274 RepID=A0A517MJ52_9BACT|nr:hypothetical protein FF011L_37130 [Roseimaritima multifibrata]